RRDDRRLDRHGARTGRRGGFQACSSRPLAQDWVRDRLGLRMALRRVRTVPRIVGPLRGPDLPVPEFWIPSRIGGTGGQEWPAPRRAGRLSQGCAGGADRDRLLGLATPASVRFLARDLGPDHRSGWLDREDLAAAAPGPDRLDRPPSGGGLCSRRSCLAFPLAVLAPVLALSADSPGGHLFSLARCGLGIRGIAAPATLLPGWRAWLHRHDGMVVSAGESAGDGAAIPDP